MKKNSNFAPGEMAEWSIAAVLKTVEPRGSGGSNPSFSADKCKRVQAKAWTLCVFYEWKKAPLSDTRKKTQSQACAAGLLLHYDSGSTGISEQSELIHITKERPIQTRVENTKPGVLLHYDSGCHAISWRREPIPLY